jgi:hypothetical protein
MIGSLLGAASRYDRVLRLLDEERRVILNGPLLELKALVEKREELLDELIADENGLPEAFLAAVKARAERNSRLILASIAGVRAAEAQIARMTEARDTLRTYSADGAAVEVTQPKVTRDTRA